MGLLIVNVIILVVGAILLAVGSGFGANAATKVTEVPNYEDVKDLKDGHTFLSTGSIIGWVTVGIIILTGILMLIFASKSGAWKWIITIMLFFVAVASIVVGSLFVVAAGKIDGTNNTDLEGATNNARIGGYMAIAGGVVVLIAAIIVIFIRAKSPELKELEMKQERLQQQKFMRRRQELAAKQKIRIETAQAKEDARVAKQLAQFKEEEAQALQKAEEITTGVVEDL